MSFGSGERFSLEFQDYSFYVFMKFRELVEPDLGRLEVKKVVLKWFRLRFIS